MKLLIIVNVLILALVLSLIVYPAYGVYSPRILSMPPDTQIMLMCALTDEEPYYNCDEKWVIYLIPSVGDVYEYCYPDQKNSFHMGVAGCATFDDERGHWAIIGNQLHMKSHTGQSVLAHELLHLKCRCNFHGA